MDDIADEDRILARQPAEARALEDARQAGLVYISDNVPGIRRSARGRDSPITGRTARGSRIPTSAGGWTRSRFRLPIPTSGYRPTPAPICRRPAGTAAAASSTVITRTGRLAARNRNSIFSLPFARSLPRIRAQVDRDLRRRKPSYDKAVAAAVFLLDRLLIRVGNPEYAHDNSSYGLTTLTSRHVRIEGQRLRFRFRGKSGKIWNLDHSDRRIARTIRSLQELPGQHLFQYVDDEGLVHSVRSSDVNDYIRAAAGDDFTSRQFRTWGGTTLCAVILARRGARRFRTPEGEDRQRRTGRRCKAARQHQSRLAALLCASAGIRGIRDGSLSSRPFAGSRPPMARRTPF